MPTLLTLGELRLEGVATSALSSPRIELTMLAYLGRRAPRSVGRGELAELFWRDRDTAKARQSLRQALLELKRLLGEGLLADLDRVGLAPGAVALDVAAFERDAAAGRWREAAGCWRGEFLGNADDLGGEDFRLWLETERETLHRALRRVLTQLIEPARGDGNWQEGLVWAERWVELLPLEEEGHRQLIELILLDGRPAEALARHAAFCSQLRAMDSEATRGFLDLGTALEHGAASAPGRRTPGSAALFTPDLTGRGQAMAELQAAWREVRAGRPAAILVEGEPGIGKSRLCEELLRQLASKPDAPIIIRARGYEAAAYDDLATITDLAVALAAAPGVSGASAQALAELAHLAPAIRERFPARAKPVGTLHALEDALLEVLDAVAAEHPVVVYFDDLSLADRATQQLLMAISGRVSGPILFLITARTGENRTSAYVELSSRMGIRRVKLQPLSLREIELLLGSMLQLAPATRHQLAERLHLDGAGNPFYTIELTAALVDEGLLRTTDGGAWQLASDGGKVIPLPATIREVVGRRLDGLSPETRAALEAAAVLGRTFDPALVAAVAGMAPSTWTVALEELIARRIVRDCTGTAGGNEFTHEIMHRAAYDLLPTPRRERLHRAAALVYKAAARKDARAQTAYNYHRTQAGSSPRRGRRWMVTAAIGSVLLLGGAALSLLRTDHARWDLQGVQVLPFENQTGDSTLAAVGRMAADWINLGLVQTRLVTIVPAEATGNGNGAAATLVHGRYYADGDSLRFRAEVLDARSGSVLFALEPVSSLRRSPMDAIERVRQRLTALLATHLNPRLSDWTSAASKPTTFEAYQEYAIGVELFLQLEYRASIVHYTRASLLDPGFAMARLDAAIAHMNLGEFHEADSIGRVVGRAAERLAPFDRYWLRWMQAHLRGDRLGALQAVRQAAELTPGSEAWYQVGYEARALNHPREAVQALRRLNPAKAGEQGWYPYWGQLTTSYHLGHDHRRELEAARAGRRQYPGILPTLAYEVRALSALGRLTDVRQLLDEALSMPLYDGWTPPTLMRAAAEELEAHGYPGDARAARGRGIAWLESRPVEEQALESHRFLLAQLCYRDNRLAEAEALFRRLAAEHPDSVSYAGYLGVLAARAGRGDEAGRITDWLGTIKRPYLGGLPTVWQARIEARRGRTEQAVERLDEAFAKGGQIDLWLHTDTDLSSLRDHPRFRGFLRPKD